MFLSIICSLTLAFCLASMCVYVCMHVEFKFDFDARSDLNRDLPEVKKFGISNCCKQRG